MSIIFFFYPNWTYVFLFLRPEPGIKHSVWVSDFSLTGQFDYKGRHLSKWWNTHCCVCSRGECQMSGAACLQWPRSSTEWQGFGAHTSTFPPLANQDGWPDSTFFLFFIFFISGLNVHFIQWQRTLPEADRAMSENWAGKQIALSGPSYFLPSASLWCLAALAAGLR